MTAFPADRELVLDRFLPFPPERVFQAWTDPALMVQWFTPAPWRTAKAETDAFTEAWAPSEKPFMVAELTFTPDGEGTRYVARVRHWTTADREAHQQMGFEPGWNAAADQLVDLLTRLG